MPTATATLSWTITNWGPLTTSLSLPSACSSRVIIYATDEPFFGNYADCDNGLFTCYPSPTDSAAPSALSEARNTFTLGAQAPPVYSPAPSCPPGWKTVGAVGREDEDASVSRSGWFTVQYNSSEIDGEDVPQAGFQDVLASLLDPEETAVMCCPSSMTIHDETGGCRSTLEDYSISTACQTHFRPGDIDDVATSIGAGEVSWTTDKTTFLAAELPSLTAEAYADPLVLLHKPTDLTGDSGGGGDDDDDEGQEENDDTGDPSETNAAAALRGGDGGFGVGGRMLASMLGSVVVGAALVLLR
ncbi:hypothetical protein BJX64DRAFT_285974 [Aspergillus heterothallicus]